MTPASATAVYSFAGAAGDRLFLDVRTALGSGSMRIIDPYGRDYVSIASFADRELTLPVAGTYTLLIEGRVWSTGANDDYGFALNRMQDPAPLALTLGERVDGALAGAGDVQRYRFALTTETLLSFDSFANNSQLRWRLSGPGYDYEAALNRADGYDQASRSPMLLAPGDYEQIGRAHV